MNCGCGHTGEVGMVGPFKPSPSSLYLGGKVVGGAGALGS